MTLVLKLLMLMPMLMMLALTLLLLPNAFKVVAYVVADDVAAEKKCRMMLAILMVPMLWC